MEISIINSILSGDCTLFTGAGFSFGAKNIEGNLVPAATGLAKILYDACDLVDDGDLNMAAHYYNERFSEDGLIKKLRDIFYISEPTEEQMYIANLNWRSIYTTNYDNVVENCLSKSGKFPVPTGIQTKPSQFPVRNNVIVHVNGSIEDLKDGESIPHSFKLSDFSYATEDFLKSAWYTKLEQDLFTSEYTIFIGCSLRSDLDLKRILQRTNGNGTRRRAVFILQKNENPTTVHNLKQYGLVYEIGLNGLMEAIKLQVPSFVPKQSNDVTTFSFHKYQKPKKTRYAQAADAFDFLFGGRLDSDIFFHSVQQPAANPYYFHRNTIDLIARDIKNGSKNILIVSGIGNGKSVAVDALANILLLDDYQVYRYEKAFDSIVYEIEFINQQPKPVIILESYAQNKDFLELLTPNRIHKNLVLIVTERTAIYETSIQMLEKLTDKAEFSFFDINDLEGDDIDNFSRLLEVHGLWGDDSRLLPSEKLRLISTECHSNTREVLLKILKSENIISKFREIVAALQEKKQFYSAIVLILTSNRFNVRIDTTFVSQVLNTQNILTTSFESNPAIRELIDFKNKEIKIRSSIVAEALLEHATDVKSIIDTLIQICTTVDEWEDETAKALLREYISYSNLKWMLDRKGQDVNDVIFHFFEQVRNLNSCKNNHHYWLQYAILDIEREQFALAHQHLQTAYSLASKKRLHYDTYQIDNQAANLLLKEVIFEKDIEEAIKKFREAHKILTRTGDPNRLRHYPYKVASLYIKFHSVFFQQMSDEQKKILITAFDEMVRKMDEYIRHVANYREKIHVKRTRMELAQLITNYENPILP